MRTHKEIQAELRQVRAERDAAQAALSDARAALNGELLANRAILGELREARAIAARPWATGVCSAHQYPDALCRICNPALAAAIRERDEVRTEAARLRAGLEVCDAYFTEFRASGLAVLTQNGEDLCDFVRAALSGRNE